MAEVTDKSVENAIEGLSVQAAIDHAIKASIASGGLPYFAQRVGSPKVKRVRKGVLEIAVTFNTGQEITLELKSEQDTPA